MMSSDERDARRVDPQHDAPKCLLVRVRRQRGRGDGNEGERRVFEGEVAIGHFTGAEPGRDGFVIVDVVVRLVGAIQDLDRRQQRDRERTRMPHAAAAYASVCGRASRLRIREALRDH